MDGLTAEKLEELLKRFTIMDLDKLIQADWNYKLEDEALSLALLNNIKREGQIVSLMVRELDTGFFEVVDGNHRLPVLLKLGMKKAMVCNLGKVSRTEAIAKAVGTNEIKFEPDNIKLAGLLNELGQDYTVEELAEFLPYDKEKLENFQKMLAFDWSNFNKNVSAEYAEDDFSKRTYNLPIAIAEMLDETILRFNRLLHPGIEDMSKISNVQAIECMCVCLRDIPDSDIIGGE